jgi:RNA polymerase sigma-70 factor (ECF subfamily)
LKGHEPVGDSLQLLRERLAELLPRLRRFARVLTHDVHDADDLVQIALERALLHIEQWRPDSKLDAWMFGIMKNAWIDELRSRQRRSRVFAPEEAGLDVGDRSAESQEHSLSLHAAMERLPDEQRIAVALVLVEGLSYKEAAAVLEVPIGTLTSRLARGRDALARTLSEGARA